MTELTFGIVVVSESCCAKIRKDKTSPLLEEAILASFRNARLISKALVPNEKVAVHNALLSLYSARCSVIFTIGGTGSSAKDITPEATKSIVEKEVPGMIYAMLSKSLHIQDMTLLSRAVCGVKGRTLIVNFPADIRSALDNFNFIKGAIPRIVMNLPKRKRDSLDKIEPHSVTSKVKITDLAKRINIPSDKVSVSGALFLMFTTCNGTNITEAVDVQNSLTRILSENVVSIEPCPPFPTAVVDGYAVKCMDGPGIRSVKKLSATNDNRTHTPMERGEVISVTSGSALPFGADAVVKINDTTLVQVSDDSSQELRVEIKHTPSVGLGVRGVGYDVPSYKTVLNKGEKLTSAHIGILSAIGRTKVTVFKRASIGIISIGKELQKFGDQLMPGHVFDSTKVMLFNLLLQHFYMAYDSGIIEDDPTSVKRALVNAFAEHDLVIFTGGIHMGEKPVIKEVLLHDFEAIIHFEQVLMIPGFTSFATCVYNGETKIVFTVPGRHSAATLCTVLLIIPFLRHLENCKDRCIHRLPLFLDKDMNLDHTQEYIKIKLQTNDEDTTIKFTEKNEKDAISKLDSFVNVNGLLRWMDAKQITGETCKDCGKKLCDDCKNKVLGTVVDVILVDLL